MARKKKVAVGVTLPERYVDSRDADVPSAAATTACPDAYFCTGRPERLLVRLVTDASCGTLDA